LDGARDELLVALRSIIGVPCAHSLATNSIKLRFEPTPDPRGRAYIWIDPPWRLTVSGTFVTGSMDWPEWDGVVDREVNQPLWEAWCAHFSPLSRAEVVEVRVGTTHPDLMLRFASGHQIETFGNTNSDYWWYYRDRFSGEVYEAGSFGIRRESGKPAAP
jgi:hypothetical protein